MANKKAKWTYELVKEYVESLGYELVSEECNFNKLILKDKENYFYISSLSRLYNNNLPRKFHTSNPYTIHNIKLWCKLNNKPFELLDNQEYKGNKEKLKWKCLKEECGEIFEGVWNDIQREKSNCICLNNKIVTLDNCLATLNPELASEWHPTKNGNLTPYDVTVSSGEKVWWQCEKGHEWETFINSRNQHGYKCPYCSGYYPSKNNNLLVCCPELCNEWNYEKNDKLPEKYTSHSRSEVWWKCKDCGYEWKATPKNRNGKFHSGCPSCNKSKGEKRIKEVVFNFNIPYIEEFKFNDLVGLRGGLLRFDTSLFWDRDKTRLRILIEYDGEQHYKWIKGMMTKKQFETLQIHDEMKNQYCKNNSIKLIRIPYWDFDNIEEIIIKELNLNDIKIAI